MKLGLIKILYYMVFSFGLSLFTIVTGLITLGIIFDPSKRHLFWPVLLFGSIFYFILLCYCDRNQDILMGSEVK